MKEKKFNGIEANIIFDVIYRLLVKENVEVLECSYPKMTNLFHISKEVYCDLILYYESIQRKRCT